MPPSYEYPVNIKDLIARARKRGGNFIKYLGLSDELRDDLELTTIVWGVGQGWFPITSDRKWHGAIDIGMPDMKGDSFMGAPVKCVGDGEVVFCDYGVCSAEGYDFGRVIMRHQTPAGEDFYAQYKHLYDVNVIQGSFVKAGEIIGTIGWHGDFPHLQLAIAAPLQIGGTTDLVPESTKDGLPEGEGAWNVLRVKIDELDPVEWPLPAIDGAQWYLYNPIEFVRYCKGEEYIHDVGRAHMHDLAPGEGHSADLQSGDNNEIKIESLLKSSFLKDNAKLQELASDPGFTPYAKGGEKEDVDSTKCIQRALKACGFSLGRFGPEGDGIDGDYGKTCATVVTKFQKEKLKNMGAFLALFDKAAKDVKESGEVDWLTLVGLDAYVAALEEAKPEEKAKPEEAKKDPVKRPEPVATPPAEGVYVFDAQAKKLSLQMGMRMYKALLNWEWDGKKGVGYSTCTSGHYGKVLPAGMGAEWPDVSALVGKDSTKEVAGFGTVPIFKCFGVNWQGTNFTNCCNSQMAALVIGCGGQTFGLKKPDGAVVSYNIRKDDVKADCKTKKDGKVTQRGALVLFEQTFVNGTPFFDKDGNPLQKSGWGGPQCAMMFLGVGEGISKFTKDQAELKKMRVGDQANYTGHAWMVGDVRYGVWFKDSTAKDKKKPDFVLDQSSFIDAATGTLVKMKGSSTKSPEGRKLMDAKDCDWVMAYEAAFEQRIADFLAATTLAAEGVAREVEKIEVANWRVWSANGTRKTGHSKTYEPSGDTYTLNEEDTKKNYNSRGITRPWNYEFKEVAFGRLYGPASGVKTEAPPPPATTTTTTTPTTPPVTEGSDAAIEGLKLSDRAKKAAYGLKKKYPSVKFTSGRRDKNDQARAMASNVVKNRTWIKETYSKSKARDECQKWLDEHPEAKTQSAIQEGLMSVLEPLSDDEMKKMSKHLSGDAFDVQPQDGADAEGIKKELYKIANDNKGKFLEKEGGLVRWHIQF